jgi:hypothetical protein
MKRYISAVLIPCLLLQLCGCYSYREVTVDELKKYEGKDDVKIITEQTEFILNRNSTEKNKLNWVINDSSIIMQEKTLMQDKYDNSTANKKTEIKFYQIKNIAVEESDSENTVVLIIGIGSLVAIIALAIYGSIQSGISNMQF